MAVSLLAHEVSDLCLGKPALRSLPIAATVADALAALKLSGDTYVSIWSCDHSPSSPSTAASCRCVGKVCMVDVICFLCRDENLSSPASALKSPVSALLSSTPNLVIHVEPHSSLLDAIDLIVRGARNLVVPIPRSSASSRRKLVQQKSHLAGPTTSSHEGREFCWLTEEDVIRFLLSSIGSFSPLPALSIDALGIVRAEALAVSYHSPAAAAAGLIARSLADQTSVAVVDDDGALVGEISPFALAFCDETAACAVATLYAGDLMAYIDGGDPPEDLVRAVKAGLRERNLVEMLGIFDASPAPSSPPFSSSSDEESSAPVAAARRFGRSWSYSARMVRRAEAIVCQPESSLVAVMIQAIAHRVNYVWVVNSDGGLAGIVTFSDMLRVFRDYLQAVEE